MSKLTNALGPFELEIEEIENGNVKISEPLVRGEGAETGVTGVLNTAFELAKMKLEFDPSLGGVAAKLERRLRRLGKAELAGVLRAYRWVAQLYPDILGTGYGGTAEDFEEFRRITVPEVLETVARWARAEGLKRDAEEIVALEARWLAALEKSE